MKVLILTAKFGMGHYSASEAIKQKIISENNSITVEIIDFFEYVFPKMEKTIYKSFEFLVSKFSFVYNFFYKFTSKTSSITLSKIVFNSFDKLIKDNNVDLVISTFPVCSRYISAYKKAKKCNIKLYTYITDIDVNKEWITDETDMYFVPAKETKLQLLKNKVLNNKIKIVGIPVKKQFKCDYQDIKNSNIEILIMGGGLGLVPCLENTIKTLLEYSNIHITLISGKNKDIIKKYKNKFSNMDVIGYTNKVYLYMKKADLIITKAGGITLFEAIYTKTPLYIVYPFLNQEKENARFIENNHIGTVVWDKKQNIAEDIIELVNQKYKLQIMKTNMNNIKNNLEYVNISELFNQTNENSNYKLQKEGA